LLATSTLLLLLQQTVFSRNLQSENCVWSPDSEVFRELHSRRYLSINESSIVEGPMWVENVRHKEKIMFWDGIIQTSWSDDRICMEYALVYTDGHRTKEWGSWYLSHTAPNCQKFYSP
jgi:hypothetical protein